MLNSETVMLIGMGIVLMIAALRTRYTQEVSVLFVLGFLGLTFGSVDVALNLHRAYSYHDIASSIYYAQISASLLKAAGYFLMTIFALFSMKIIKKQLGGIVRWLWLAPIPVLLLAYAKDIGNSNVLDILAVSIEKGFSFKFPPRPVYLEVISQFFAILSVFLTGFCFQRICQRDPVVYAQPEPQPAVPVSPVQEWPVRPQPELRHRAPEPPKQTAQINNQDVQKKIQAYNDLLECEILSQEEYDQKIRELTRGW